MDAAGAPPVARLPLPNGRTLAFRAYWPEGEILAAYTVLEALGMAQRGQPLHTPT